jgi:hypothetical protein
MKMSGEVAEWGLVLAPWQCPAHTASSILQCLAKNKMVVVSHPLYSPDLTPCDFFLYPRMKQVWNGGVPLMLQWFNETRWRPLTAFSLKTVDNVYSRGSSAGITAFSHRGSTLKGTEVSNVYEHFK